MMTIEISFATTLEKFFNSDDFKSGVVASTRASWGGSGYSVELFPDGHFSVLWDNQIGNLYTSPGVILGIPTFTDDGTYQEAVIDGDMSEEDYFDLCFGDEESELAQSMRDALAE